MISLQRRRMFSVCFLLTYSLHTRRFSKKVFPTSATACNQTETNLCPYSEGIGGICRNLQCDQSRHRFKSLTMVTPDKNKCRNFSRATRVAVLCRSVILQGVRACVCVRARVASFAMVSSQKFLQQSWQFCLDADVMDSVAQAFMIKTNRSRHGLKRSCLSCGQTNSI